MTAQEKIAAKEVTAVHANVYVALAAAQAEMGPLLKGELNPHFNKKYAGLADVVDVVREPLTRHGLCFYHAIQSADGTPLMDTVLSHGGSGTEICCSVPMIVERNNMQGFKSATTYAKRIGLESVTGVAPEDDDGNDAAKNAPVVEQRRQPEPRQPQQPPKVPQPVMDAMGAAATIDSLKQVWTANKDWQSHPDFKAAKDRRKSEIEAPARIDDSIPY